MNDVSADFEAQLRHLEPVFTGDAEGATPFTFPPLQRLVTIIREGPPFPKLDLAVLIRQTLRFWSSRTHTRQWLEVPTAPSWPAPDDWRAVGVSAVSCQSRYRLSADPWCPSWLPHVGPEGVDGSAVAAWPRRQRSSVPGDPFLHYLGLQHYQSPGQRAALRAALTTPPGAQLLICLPTGEGKSLLFQAVARFGFGVGSSLPGVTLVVVPTVALAMDQERAAVGRGFDDKPRAYVSGQELRNEQIGECVADGTQGLCFASPEAVCGPLRRKLEIASSKGLLRAFFIDEAHVVDSWGADFRPDFQVLSGIRRQLLTLCPPGAAFRTYYLSATYTQGALDTLRRLFVSPGDQFAVCSAACLRPEPEYWVAPFSNQRERDERVLEALLHLPRPAILYTTKVDVAEAWHRQLRGLGFCRLACVTGKTSADERHRVVDEWCQSSLDLVVATSAFGLGIDNPQVRTIIHACLPETLDRFYQEVGRAGRDGCASISLLLPTCEDRGVARTLNRHRPITVERGLQRWQSMFHHPARQEHGNDIYTLRLDVPPGSDAGDIDMVSEASAEWNRRTLTLMASAGLLELYSPTSQQEVTELEAAVDDNGGAWHSSQTVRILDHGHLDRATWDDRIAAERRRIKRAFRQSLESLLRYVASRECIADTLAPLYSLSAAPDTAVPGLPVRVARACGGCPYCRSHGLLHPRQLDIVAWPRLPWLLSPLEPGLAQLLAGDGRLLVYCPPDAFRGDAALGKDSRRLLLALARLIQGGARSLILLRGCDLNLSALQSEIGDYPFFLDNTLTSSSLPEGPSLVVATDPRSLPAEELLCSRSLGRERFFFLPRDFPAPDRPGTFAWDVVPGRRTTLDELLTGMGL